MANFSTIAGESAEIIRRGSLSFSLAGRLLSGPSRNAIFMLYNWCRYCDDVIDGQVLGGGALCGETGPDAQAVRSVQEAKLGELIRATTEALACDSACDIPAMNALACLASQYSVPKFYFDEFLAGMCMDVDGQRYQNLEDLLHYCYRVAGTVGIMFVHITGASHEAARQHAANLGIAMQLTNIARDVAADYAAGRIYLPLTWLAEAGIPPDRLLDEAYRSQLLSVVERLLDEADRYYSSGDAGIGYLPLRAALGVSVARWVYAEIGAKIRRVGTKALDERVVISTPRKLQLVALALAQTAKLLPSHMLRRWRPAQLTGVWRLT